MKKLALTIAIVLGLSMTTFAQGGLFQRGNDAEPGDRGDRGGFVNLPGHGETTDQDAPVGTGIAVLTAIGVAYLIGKRRKEEI